MTMAVDNESRARSRVGQVLKEKWRLDALLGIGGMAAVYAATHRNQKRVAIKMLLPELANHQEVRDRFVREGYAANTIEHPGALSVLDDDVSEDGLPFLVMELLDGETVEARWLRAGQRLELPEVLAIASAVLDVLGAAHAKGVVHRDIKPENLFLLRAGGLKVLDFGIARVLERTPGRGSETRAGTVMGTPAFMAPEQALAKWDQVDGRTDLWAVGATMFTLVSGQHVHEAANGNEQFVKSATQPARSVGSCTKGLPRSVIALIDRALKFDRATRWPDARAMQEAVSGAYEALTGTPLVIEAPPAMSGPVSSARSARTMPGGRPSGEIAVTLPSSGQRPPPPPPPARTAVGPRPPPPPPRPTSGAFPSAPRSAERPSVRSRQASGEFDEVADASIMNPVAGGPALGLAPPPMEALGVDAYVAGRNSERDAAVAELARLQPIVAEIQGRLAGVRRRVAQAQEQLAEARKEKATEEERFRKQMNARLGGLGEARKAYRRAMSEVARAALEDPAHFPPAVGAADRAAIQKTAAAAELRVRELKLHEAALLSFDPKAFKTGMSLGAAALVLFLVLFFSPVLVRSCASDTGTIGPTSSAP